MDHFTHYESPLGGITLSSNGEALTGLWFDGDDVYGDVPADLDGKRDEPAFAKAREWLDIYFSGRDPGFMPPMALETTPFREEVCRIMLGIPFGHTMSYGQIAKIIARRRGSSRMSAQAVGGAVGHNPISLIIPCHRVVGTNGSLTGYGGGMDRKIRLLQLEGVDMSGFFVPGKA